VQFCQEAAKSRKLISKKPVKLTRAKNMTRLKLEAAAERAALM